METEQLAIEKSGQGDFYYIVVLGIFFQYGKLTSNYGKISAIQMSKLPSLSGLASDMNRSVCP